MNNALGVPKSVYLCDPCRNFNVFTHILMEDPKDHREKLIMSNYVGGGAGFLKIIDVETNEYEDILFPGDPPDKKSKDAEKYGYTAEGGAWTLFNLGNGKILVGTCPRSGFILTLDLKTRSWVNVTRDPDEAYIYSFTRGSDGLIYCGTYPGCVLLRYNPDTGLLDNLGKMSEYDDNLFSQYVYSVNDYIMIECLYGTTHVSIWDIKEQKVKKLGRNGLKVRYYDNDFICLVNENNTMEFYNAKTLEKTDRDLYINRLKAEDEVLDKRFYIGLQNVQRCYIKNWNENRITCFRGQDYYIADRNCKRPKLIKIPGPAPITSILEIVSDSEGKVWGSTGFGQTVFCYNPDNNTYSNTPDVCTHTGEVFGMRFIDGKLFMSAYAGADHIVYDPEKPWNQYDNVNPRTLESGRPYLSRPTGKSIVGPDGAFWTGWMARYGAYGGGISRVDPKTYEVKIWKDPIREQSIAFCGLVGNKEHIYFSSSVSSNGLPNREEETCYLVIWDCEKGIIDKIPYEKGLNPGRMCLAGNYIITAFQNKLSVFDIYKGRFVREAVINGICSCIIEFRSEYALVFCGRDILLLNPSTGSLQHFADSPGDSSSSYQAYNIGACFTPDGRLYFAEGSHLYRLEI